jgi:hypothetical protein
VTIPGLPRRRGIPSPHKQTNYRCVVEPVKQFPHRATQKRMAKIRRELAEWHQDEAALMQARVGQK